MKNSYISLQFYIKKNNYEMKYSTIATTKHTHNTLFTYVRPEMGCHYNIHVHV